MPIPAGPEIARAPSPSWAAARGTRVLAVATWRRSAAEHAHRARALTQQARDRRARGIKHPVEDFLFEYYGLRPGALDRWEPGAGVALARPHGARVRDDGPSDTDRRDGPGALQAWEAVLDRRWYTRSEIDGAVVTHLDAAAYLADRRDGVRAMAEILRATSRREPHLGCLGLHEWAMVYRQDRHRHPLPLRLGQDGTDAVVEASTIRCTHFDAFRFFTPAATPRNLLQPTRTTQANLEQPGCLHANMDLLRWSLKLGPLVPGDLLLDCFELARDIRVLDMEASPYDCRELGYGVVAIETAQGRAEYIARQRTFAERAAPLRERLLGVLGDLTALEGLEGLEETDAIEVAPGRDPTGQLSAGTGSLPR